MSCLCVWRYYFSPSLSPKHSFRLSYTSIYLAEFVPGSLSLSLSANLMYCYSRWIVLLVASWIKHSVGTQLMSSPHPPSAPLFVSISGLFCHLFYSSPEKDAPGYDIGVFYGKAGGAMAFTAMHPKYGDRALPSDPPPLPPQIPGGYGDFCTAMSAVYVRVLFCFFGPSLYYCIVGIVFSKPKKKFCLGSSPLASIKCCPAAHPRIFHELVPARLHTVVLVFHALNIVVEQGWYWCSAPSKNSNREGADCANIVAAGWSLGKHL